MFAIKILLLLASASVAFSDVDKFHHDSALNAAPHLRGQKKTMPNGRTAGDETTPSVDINIRDGQEESAVFWSRAMMASMPIGGEATTWSQTPGCRKSVFYGANFKAYTVVAPTEDRPGSRVDTFDLKSHPTDDVIIGTGQGQLPEFIGGSFDGTFISTGSYLFNGKGGFGQGEIFWVDYERDFLGTENPSHSFVGDSGFAITGGHGDFKCATGWLDLTVVEPKNLTFNDKGEWDQNTDGLIWKVDMYTCGICENSD